MEEPGNKTPSHSSPNIFQVNPEETGWERVKMIFQPSEVTGFGGLEMAVVTTVGLTSLISGVAIGGFFSARKAYEDTLRRTKATPYTSSYEAQRYLQDSMTLAIIRGGWKLGWRLGLFTSSYTLVAVMGAVYQNEMRVWHHVVAGAACGSLWRAWMGVRAMAVSGLVGSVLGLMGGTLITSVFYIRGISVAELRYWQHNYWKEDLRKRGEALKRKETSSTDLNPLEASHDERLKRISQQSSS